MLLTYLGRRLILAVVALFGVILTAFLVAHSVPADPLAMVLSEQATKDPDDPRRLHQALGARPIPARAVRRLPRQRVARGSRRILHDPAPRPAGPEAVPSGHHRALAGRARGGRVRRRTAGRLGGSPPQPAGRSRRAGRIAGRRRVADLLDWSDRALRLLLPPRVGAGARSTRQSPDDAAPRHRDSYWWTVSLPGNGELFVAAVRHLVLPAFVLGWFIMGLIARTTRSSLARGAPGRLRAHRPLEGARRGPRRGFPCAAQRPDPGCHRRSV